MNGEIQMSKVAMRFGEVILTNGPPNLFCGSSLYQTAHPPLSESWRAVAGQFFSNQASGQEPRGIYTSAAHLRWTPALAAGYAASTCMHLVLHTHSSYRAGTTSNAAPSGGRARSHCAGARSWALTA